MAHQMPTINARFSRWQRELIRPILRYQRRAIVFFLVSTALVAVGLMLCPKKYQSESKLFVRVGRENATLDPTASTGQIIALNASRETEINSIVEHLDSRCIVEKTLQRVNPAAAGSPPEQREKAIRELRDSITISSPRRSTVVKIKCTATSPQEAQKTVTAMVDVYLDEHMRISRPSGSHKFFSEQAEMLESRLNDAQTKLCDAKSSFGFSSLSDRTGALEDQASQVEIELRQVAAALSASRAKIATLEAKLRQLPETLVRQLVGGTPNDGLAGMREELFQLRTREEELLSKYTEQHPAAIAVRDQVRHVEAALQREQLDQQEPIAAILAMEIANRDSLAARQECLLAQRSELQRRLTELNQHEMVINKLNREVQQLESRYLTYLGSSEQARVDQALQADRISNVSIVQPASYAPTPVGPRKAFVLALAMVVGACGGLGLAFVSDYLSQPPTNPREAGGRHEAPAFMAAPRSSLAGVAAR